MSRIDSDGRQHPELPEDLARIGPPGEPMSTFLTLFYYGKGVFPWLSKDGRSLWWSPQPRSVLFCHELHVNRSLRKFLRKNRYRVTCDTVFDEVVRSCRDQVRGPGGGSWIDVDWVAVMGDLHLLGHAHSIEVWEEDQLVGGLFGICVGQMFYGCSMFHTRPNASKVALVHLVERLAQWEFPVIDCALSNPYLKQMGAQFVPREKFLGMVSVLVRGQRRIGPWTEHFK